MAAAAASPPSSKQLRLWALAIAIGVLAFLATATLAPHVPLDPSASLSVALAAYLLAYACVAACVLAAAGVAPDLGGRALVVVGAALAALVPLRDAAPTLLGSATVLGALLAAGTASGAALGTRVQAAGHLLPVAVVSSVADAVSVLTPGAPSDVVVATPALLSVVALPWPFLGTDDRPPILGVGDVAFAALYVAAARKHGLSPARTSVALALGLAATALAVAGTGLPLPALPALGAAVVLAHPEARAVPAADRAAALVGCVLAIGVGLAVWLARR